MRIGSIIICHVSKLWKVKFSILCDVMFLVRLQENLTMITLTPLTDPGTAYGKQFTHRRISKSTEWKKAQTIPEGKCIWVTPVWPHGNRPHRLLIGIPAFNGNCRIYLQFRTRALNGTLGFFRMPWLVRTQIQVPKEREKDNHEINQTGSIQFTDRSATKMVIFLLNAQTSKKQTNKKQALGKPHIRLTG